MTEDYSQGWIDLGSDLDVAEFIRTVHSLSSAQGLGFLHDKKGPLPDSEIQPYLADLKTGSECYMDYIAGRSIKMSIHLHEDHYFVRDGAWYDHSDGEFNELLARFGVSRATEQPEHNSSCQCDDCKPNHPIRSLDKALGLCGITVSTSETGKLGGEVETAIKALEAMNPEVELKNGSTEQRTVVDVTMGALNCLLKTNPIVAYELVMLCRDPQHKPWGESGKDLKAASLANDSSGMWKVDESVRNVVLSASRGEDMAEMTFGSPVK